MRVEIDKADQDHVFGRVTFEGKDREWLAATPALRVLTHALLAFEMKLRGLGKVPAHLEGFTSRTGIIFVECWRFKKDGVEAPSFLRWSTAGEPAVEAAR